MVAELCPEPTNPYDDQAVAVRIAGRCVGYLSRSEARTFRPLVDRAIASAGRAAAEACVRGGWDRGASNVGHLGVVVLATLTEVPANPHAKKDSGPVLQVSVNGATVGHLTPAMSERLRRMTNRSQAEGRRVTCSAHVFRGEKRGQPMLEIRLSAVPQAHDENVVVDPYFQVSLDLVRTHRSAKVHRISTTDESGSYRTACGVTIAAHDARLMGSTKPWVGDIDPTTRAIIADADHCVRCQ